mmetsp:Transcript_100241/g.230149  ORF Transcript_100241/g.230149 Transcript_100241/m.230149 type:complete len:202 (+) Transcript_100241:350-955(+)
MSSWLDLMSRRSLYPPGFGCRLATKKEILEMTSFTTVKHLEFRSMYEAPGLIGERRQCLGVTGPSGTLIFQCLYAEPRCFVAKRSDFSDFFSLTSVRKKEHKLLSTITGLDAARCAKEAWDQVSKDFHKEDGKFFDPTGHGMAPFCEFMIMFMGAKHRFQKRVFLPTLSRFGEHVIDPFDYVDYEGPGQISFLGGTLFELS